MKHILWPFLLEVSGLQGSPGRIQSNCMAKFEHDSLEYSYSPKLKGQMTYLRSISYCGLIQSDAKS